MVFIRYAGSSAGIVPIWLEDPELTKTLLACINCNDTTWTLGHPPQQIQCLHHCRCGAIALCLYLHTLNHTWPPWPQSRHLHCFPSVTLLLGARKLA